ncbi:predicted GPI-anchored protein 58 [Portunus trituberculatus]|uniref:predicted GPI-anchored protein 58 n=1 Tax=Portunus trituberculatus TaxID=210409 RepID=UPI001E1CE098|nr:predicted GPI-anchored protein 58 [Portunus trituberculatus]
MPTPSSALSGLSPKGSLPRMSALLQCPLCLQTLPQAGITQELPATDTAQQVMAVVSALAAKVDNLTATVSGLSTKFAAFKNQQHTVCSGTSTVAPTPSPASGAQQGQGESAVCQHSLCDPPKKKDNAAGQCAIAAAPTPRMDTPAKPVKGSTRQLRSPSGMAPAPLASESKSPAADCEEDNADCQPQARSGTSDGSHADADGADVLPDTGSGQPEDTDATPSQ